MSKLSLWRLGDGAVHVGLDGGALCGRELDGEQLPPIRLGRKCPECFARAVHQALLQRMEEVPESDPPRPWRERLRRWLASI